MSDAGPPPDDPIGPSPLAVPPYRDIQPARDPYHPDTVRAIVTYGLLAMIATFLFVLAIETVRGILSPTEFAEIVGPVIVGTAAGVFGYYFNPERRG